MPRKFNYDEAFSRNIGWVTREEQQLLKNKRVAIAGLGGVGGDHVITLSRLGIGALNISDLDFFEVANFNRQAGAFVSTVGQPKESVIVKVARDINPEISIQSFSRGIDVNNLDAFLKGVDLYIDGLDYFAVDIRRKVFAACEEKKIPAITAAPLGMGAALLVFIPGKMGFEDYFQLEGRSEVDQLIRFLVGLSPAMLQRRYLVDPSSVDFPNHKGPSTPMACKICAGMAAVQALKILLGRGRVICAPRSQQFDPYRNKYAVTWRPLGNRNPIQRTTIAIAKRMFNKPRILS